MIISLLASFPIQVQMLGLSVPADLQNVNAIMQL